jgi:hypothetical protein
LRPQFCCQIAASHHRQPQAIGFYEYLVENKRSMGYVFESKNK